MIYSVQEDLVQVQKSCQLDSREEQVKDSSKKFVLIASFSFGHPIPCNIDQPRNASCIRGSAVAEVQSCGSSAEGSKGGV